MEWLALLAGLVIVFVITIATGYFVAQEFSYMAVDRSGLAALAAKGDAGAERALGITRRTSFLLSGAQLGITVTGLLVGYVAEPLIGQSLGTLLGGAGIPTAVAIGVGGLTALAFSTLVQMLFGELFPKNLAIAQPERLALGLARSTRWYLAVFGWLIQFFDASANVLLRLLRIEPVHDVEHAASARDLEEIVAESRHSGDLDPELSMMLDRILDFPSHDVAHAMIPRTQVDTCLDTDTIGELRRKMAAQGHSRYPVLAEDTDEVVGVIHLADVLSGDLTDSTPLGAVVRPAVLVPDLMPLMSAVEELMTTRSYLACVVDEYGGFSGVLTMEDLAEELVGEITDEHDGDVGATLVGEPDDAGSRVMSGAVHLDEVERALDIELPRGSYETLAGLAIAAHGDLPAVGTTIEVELPIDPADLALDTPPAARRLAITVLAVEHHVPARVRVALTPASAAEGGDA
jgi:CBS domain containing-hemolysin-like protein